MEPPLVLLLLPFCFVAWRATIGPSGKDIMCMQGKKKQLRGQTGAADARMSGLVACRCPDAQAGNLQMRVLVT